MILLRAAFCAAFVWWAVPAAAQSILEPKVDAKATEPAPASTESEPIVDVNAIDPETFQAIAARLPEGMAPKIDGRLDDEAWGLAQAMGNFVQREPRLGAPASERTEFRILYDDRKLYFGV